MCCFFAGQYSFIKLFRSAFTPTRHCSKTERTMWRDHYVGDLHQHHHVDHDGHNSHQQHGHKMNKEDIKDFKTVVEFDTI